MHIAPHVRSVAHGRIPRSEAGARQAPARRATSIRIEGEDLSHASGEQPALNPYASTLKPGGSIAVTSWAPVDQSPAMQTMFGALRAIKPDLPQPQRSVATLENPERFKQELEEAGFRNVEIRSVTKAFPTGSTAEFLDSMVKGSAPIQMMKKGMGEELWREKEKIALAWLEETLPALKGPLTSDAWLGVGVK